MKGNIFVAAIIYLGLAILVVAGYVMNISALLKAGAIATWGGMEVARVVGIFIPFLGSILGFC